MTSPLCTFVQVYFILLTIFYNIIVLYNKLLFISVVVKRPDRDIKGNEHIQSECSFSMCQSYLVSNYK